MSLSAVSEESNTLEQLIELRRILADAIDKCESNRDLASLSRRYCGVIESIDRIEGGNSDDDEIAAIIIRNRQSDTD